MDLYKHNDPHQSSLRPRVYLSSPLSHRHKLNKPRASLQKHRHLPQLHSHAARFTKWLSDSSANKNIRTGSVQFALNLTRATWSSAKLRAVARREDLMVLFRMLLSCMKMVPTGLLGTSHGAVNLPAFAGSEQTRRGSPRSRRGIKEADEVRLE